MYSSVNICGRLTKDLELRETLNQIPYVRFTVAVNNVRSSSNSTTYVNCTAWRKVAINMCDSLQKGSLILVEGRLQSDLNQNLEISVNFVYYLESKKSVEQKKSIDQPSTTVETETVIRKEPDTKSQVDSELKTTVTESTDKSADWEVDQPSTSVNVESKKKEPGIDWDAE